MCLPTQHKKNNTRLRCCCWDGDQKMRHPCILSVANVVPILVGVTVYIQLSIGWQSWDHCEAGHYSLWKCQRLWPFLGSGNQKHNQPPPGPKRIPLWGYFSMWHSPPRIVAGAVVRSAARSKVNSGREEVDLWRLRSAPTELSRFAGQASASSSSWGFRSEIHIVRFSGIKPMSQCENSYCSRGLFNKLLNFGNRTFHGSDLHKSDTTFHANMGL